MQNHFSRENAGLFILGGIMNKYLLQFGGAINLLFVLFQLALLKPIAALLSPLSPDIRATVSTFNVQVTFALLAFAWLV